MGAAASVATSVTRRYPPAPRPLPPYRCQFRPKTSPFTDCFLCRSVGAHRLLGEMPPGKRLKEERGASGPVAGGSGEGIDGLPDGVLAHIIGFLPAEEAVRTCVLARRWRDLWKSATGLRVVAGYGQFLGTVEKLVEFVDRLLALRGGASLDTCVLEVDSFSVPDGNWDNDNGVLRRLNIWLKHAVECRVQFVRIQALCHKRVCPAYPVMSSKTCLWSLST